MDRMLSVKISTGSSPLLFISANPNEFGRIFSSMNSEEQVHVLRAMAEHMKPHKLQWDYIAIELDRPENADVKSAFAQMIGG